MESPSLPPDGRAPTTTNQMARISMILGIIGVIGGVILTSFPAIVCGHLALREISDSGGKQHGKAMARAGLILGYPVTILSALVILYIGWFLWWSNFSPAAGI